MSKEIQDIGYLYVNGLGYGKDRPQEKLMRWWWKQAGIELEHLQTNWYDDGMFDEKLLAAIEKVEAMLRYCGGVAIIGTSAGGSLALNAFCDLKDKNVCLVSSHGRLKVGDYPDTDRRSMHRRARFDTDKPLQAFADSVEQAEAHLAHDLTDKDKQRILVLDQLTDLIVPLETMQIDGAKTHRSMTLGHSGGLLAHMIADRDLITQFASQALTEPEA